MAAAVVAAGLLAGCGSADGGDDAAAASASNTSATGVSAQPSGQGGVGEAGAASGGTDRSWRNDPLYDTDAARLIAQGMDQKMQVVCTANGPDGITTAYVDGKRLRLDVGDGPGAQHFLTDGENTDFWQDDRPGGNVFIGAKAYAAVHSMVRNLGVNLDALRARGGEQAAMLGPDTQITCSEYTGDDAVFTPPPGRDFTTAQQIRGIVGGGD